MILSVIWSIISHPISSRMQENEHGVSKQDEKY
jgi:hypothetical protein